MQKIANYIQKTEKSDTVEMQKKIKFFFANPHSQKTTNKNTQEKGASLHAGRPCVRFVCFASWSTDNTVLVLVHHCVVFVFSSSFAPRKCKNQHTKNKFFFLPFEGKHLRILSPHTSETSIQFFGSVLLPLHPNKEHHVLAYIYCWLTRGVESKGTVPLWRGPRGPSENFEG